MIVNANREPNSTKNSTNEGNLLVAVMFQGDP